jgi:hypothetical protein
MTETKKPEDVPPEVEALHPMVVSLFSLLRTDEAGRFFLPEPSVHDLYSALLQYEGDEELGHIVHGLTAMAVTMREQHDSPDLADQILLVLESDEVAKAIKRLSISGDPEAVEEAAKRFAQFAGGSAALTAPRADAPRPEGTLTIDKLSFPRRM